jgi:hypothetical protein
VQLRFQTGLTGEEYVTREAWREARLLCCPLHLGGGCGLTRHGTYARKTPRGTKISRWYCPEGHCTFSLLPDHLAARFPGTLVEIERVVETVESAPSVEAAAEVLRPDPITLPSAVRWIRRRVAPVRALLVVLIGMFPQMLLGCTPRLGVVRARLGCAWVLMAMREQACAHLAALCSPLGFRHRTSRLVQPGRAHQQSMGPDPPGVPR